MTSAARNQTSSARTASSAAKWLLPVVAALNFVACAYIAYFDYRVITLPAPVEYREPGVLLTTDLLLRGGDPYALDRQPAYTNVYGVGYNLLVEPFAKLLGNTFVVHRAVSFACLIASLLLIYRLLRRLGVLSSLAFVACVALFADLGARCATLEHALGLPAVVFARPDSLATLLFLLSVLLPWRGRFSHATMATAGGLAILAFFTKPYLVIGYPIVLAYVFLFRSKSRALLHGVGFATLLGVSVGLAVTRLDTFYAIVLKGNEHSYQPRWSHLREQLLTYLKSAPGMIALLAIVGCAGFRRLCRLLRFRGINWRRLGAIRPIRQPLFAVPVDFLWFVLICCAAMLVFRFGRHVGSSMTYFYQLFSPFMLLIVFRSFRRRRMRRSVIVSLLLLLDGVLLLSHGLSAPPRVDVAVWNEWRSILADKKDVYVGPPLAWIAREQGKEIYDGGMSEYFVYFALAYPETDYQKQMVAYYQAYREHLKHKVRREQFDLIVLPMVGRSRAFSLLSYPLVREHYREVRRLDMPMGWPPMYQGVILVPKGTPEVQ